MEIRSFKDDRGSMGAGVSAHRESIIGLLDEADFSRAAQVFPEFQGYSYDDYLCELDCLVMSLDWAGVVAVQIPVSLDAFRAWCAQMGATADKASLDSFAKSQSGAQGPTGASFGSKDGEPAREFGFDTLLSFPARIS